MTTMTKQQIIVEYLESRVAQISSEIEAVDLSLSLSSDHDTELLDNKVDMIQHKEALFRELQTLKRGW